VGVVAGEVIVRHGDHGDRFFVLDAGEVVVDGTGGERRLAAGAWFGEIALVQDVPRTASVTAATAVRLITVPRELFLEALALDPRASDTASRHAARLAAGVVP
jgi:CRP-like cAMP-binding protein